MRLKFENCFRVYLIVLAAMLIWAVWAGAQPVATNAPADKATNATRLIQGIAEIKETYLTFGLDKLDFLRASHTMGSGSRCGNTWLRSFTFFSRFAFPSSWTT